jgi:uncharacterized protein YkwD
METPRFRLGTAVAMAAIMLLTAIAPAVAATPARATSAEKYALNLLICTRSGGWVTEKGTCRGRGSGKHSAKRPPLKLSKGISRKVAWPWARALTSAQDCAHVLEGRPVLGERLNSKGFNHQFYGENVGCGWGGAPSRRVVLATHRAMQAEKSYGGGHWKNMKRSGYKSVGIGVATMNGRTTVVFDFYGKRTY